MALLTVTEVGQTAIEEDATLAAAEFKWDTSESVSRLAELRAYSDSLRVPR